MLPGFRLVCATVVLAISLVVFGLGAAALLRASHDQFASLPSAQAPREPLLAREGEMRQATLALLRVEMMAEQAEAPKTTADTADNASVPPVAVAAVAPSGAAAAEPSAVGAGEETAARDEVAPEAPQPVAPPITVGAAADRAASEASARADVTVVAMADDKPAPVAAPPGGSGCLPTASPQPGPPLAMLVDQGQPHADAALPAAKPHVGKSGIHRAHHARVRHRHARLRRHRLLLQAQAQAQAAAFAVQQQQAQQVNPFFGLPATRTH